ncbi:AAA family ATPase [Wenzhouxiangella limi]|uniref:AAA family ATPase n=1 Tax=Wenzhouxiangella limi TaxID=2707351 RepID=A0A845V283_9GAMM|nr:bifunctional aminoglycoside phosphotransferase/ATP-binding protein [Wenzhouxiangella limi]NDY95366.1 AAA family ATPase [Wenzhouxiangella limi]
MHSPLIDALRDPACYPHPVSEVALTETHISWVLLAGDYAYKIKKPVDFGFLDFSTLQRRQYFCQEEIRLNRRTALDLYIDVTAISGVAEEPEIGGAGEPIEYAVRMQRFDPADGFDRLMEAGRLEASHVESLGEALADLHEVAEPAPGDSKWGSPAEVIGPMRDNFTTLRERLSDAGRRARLARLAAWTEDRFAALRDRIQERRTQGFVRECHGDVHLGNVTLFECRTTLFDCIEFSPDLRWTDVMADLAFVVMDLRERGAASHAWRLLDRYLARTGDYAGLALLDFYVVYRALVRAKVAALGLDNQTETADADRILATIDSHLALALKVAGERRPALILTCGVSGSGKSHLARSLLADCGLIRLRSDVERKRLFGLDELARTQSPTGGGLYGPEATARTYQRLRQLAGAVTDAALPVLVDATFLEPEHRQAFADLAGRRQIPFGVLVCTADERVLRERVGQRADDGSDASEADLEVLDRQLASFDPPAEDDELMVIDTAAAGGEARARAWIARLLSGG